MDMSVIGKMGKYTPKMAEKEPALPECLRVRETCRLGRGTPGLQAGEEAPLGNLARGAGLLLNERVLYIML
jgi:hypothetical protein